MSIGDLIAVVNSQAGTIPLLLLAIIGSLREWWVPGAAFREMREERDEWKRLALLGTDMAEQLTKVVPAPRKRATRGP